MAMKMRYSSSELSLIKTTFAEQEDLMVLIRKFLLQGKMHAEEMNLLQKYFSNPDVIAVLKKAVTPEIDKLAPPHQTVDLFSNLDMNPTPYDHANLAIKGRWVAKTYLEQRFAEAEGKKVKNPIIFDDLTKPTEDEKQTYINFVARNFLLPFIDQQLFNSIMILAGTKEETPEEQKARLTKDSSK